MFESFVGKRFFVHFFFDFAARARRHKYSNKCVFWHCFLARMGMKIPELQKVVFQGAKSD